MMQKIKTFVKFKTLAT